MGRRRLNHTNHGFQVTHAQMRQPVLSLHFNEAGILLPQRGTIDVRVSEHSVLVELIGQDGCPETERRRDIRRRVEDESCVSCTANPVESES